jgi:predicted dehydrogenase
MNKLAFFLTILLAIARGVSGQTETPVRLALMGLVHDHVYSFMDLAQGRSEIRLVGIVEPDAELWPAFAKRFNLSNNFFHPTLEDLLSKTKVDAVATFTSTLDHRRVVEACAPLHIPVMVEKPLAVNMEEARGIEAAAKRGGIQVIVNYETTWYRSTDAAYKLAEEEHAIGSLRKMEVWDGHRGPKEIGCSETFLKWLTDPKLDGGGALMDFGCYGAGLMTWFMEGQRPTSVFAVTQQIKPEVYPKVEDDATIVLTYPKMEGVIHASWNLPNNRKDMEIYGTTGYVLAPRKDLLRTWKIDAEESELDLPELPPAGHPRDQISYLASIVRGETQPSGPSSLEVNLIVTEILDAARESARTGRRVMLGSAMAR